MLIAVSSLLATTLALYPPLLIAYLVMLVFLTAYLTQQKPQYTYPLLIITFLTLLSAILPASLIGGVSRSINIIIGTVIAAVYQLIFLPWFYNSEMNATVESMLKSLLKLTDDIFICFLQPAYPENIYLFERRIHLQKKRCICLLQHAKAIDRHAGKHTKTLASLEKIFELLLSCALLRIRITDQTIFAVCISELTEVYDELKLNLKELTRIYRHQNPYMNVNGLEDRIERFENSYQTVLQVAAREPLVFLLFISSFRALKDEIAQFE
jgi:uncharacterized membrane protein YccC